MADDKNGAASCKFELEVKIKPAKDEKPSGGAAVVVVCILLAALLILWILSPSLWGAQSPTGPGGYPPPVSTFSQYQVPYQLPDGGGGPPRTAIPSPGR